MAGEDIQSWSPIAVNNGTADTGINWIEGMPRADVNNSSRSMMAAHAKQRDMLNGSIVTSGSANAQTAISPIPYTAVPTGLRMLVKIGPALTNTGSTTFNLDGIGAVTIKTCFGSELSGGEMVAGAYADLLYDGTNWILVRDPRAGIQMIKQETVGGAEHIIFTAGLDAAYDEYVFVLTNVLSSADDQFVAEVSTDGGSIWNVTPGTYRGSIQTVGDNGVSAIGGRIDLPWILLTGNTSSNAAFGISGEFRLYTPSTTGKYKSAHWSLSYFDGANFKAATGTCAITLNVPINGIRFLFEGGFLSGTIAMYGIKKQ